MKTEGNEPANPVSMSDRWTGLTKRELLAAMAMQGIVARSNAMGTNDKIAKVAVSLADELIKALNESSTEN